MNEDNKVVVTFDFDKPFVLGLYAIAIKANMTVDEVIEDALTKTINGDVRDQKVSDEVLDATIADMELEIKVGMTD